MADAKRCDACGEFYAEGPAKRYATGIIVERGLRSSAPVCLVVVAKQATDSGLRSDPVDLCATCIDHALVDAVRSQVREQQPTGV